MTMRSLIAAVAMLGLSACGGIPLDSETANTVIENQAWADFDQACEEFTVQQALANDRFDAVPPAELDISQTYMLDSRRDAAAAVCARTDNPGQNAILVRTHTSFVRTLDGRKR